jgi:hypothetical protein
MQLNIISFSNCVHIVKGGIGMITVPYLFFIVMSFWARQYFRQKKILFFILLAFFICLFVRIGYYFSGTIAIRYMMPILPLAVILGIPGFFLCVKVIRNHVPNSCKRYVLFAMLISISIAGIAKSLHFRDRKMFLETVSKDIQRISDAPADKLTYISDIDLRPGYLCGLDTDVIVRADLSLAHISKICRNKVALGRKVFLFMFNDGKINNEKAFVKLKEYTIKKNKKAFLYQYNSKVNK